MDNSMPEKPPITALIYTDSDRADRALREIAIGLMEQGWRLAGLVQLNTPRPGGSRCDMILEELTSGELRGISQDRGQHARGCALDIGQLLAAMQGVEAALDETPDLVTESEGAGFRPLIAKVIGMGLPLLIAVPWRNIESWRLFAGDLAEEISLGENSTEAMTICARIMTERGSFRRSARKNEMVHSAPPEDDRTAGK